MAMLASADTETEISSDRTGTQKNDGVFAAAETSTVLIVDDSSPDRFLYERLLSTAECNYNVLKAETAEQGLVMLEEQQPDCVLLDYWLPKASGVEFLQEIQRRNIEVPIVMLTGESDAQVTAQAFRFGARDYLVKGRVTVEALHGAIRKAIDSHAKTDEADEPQVGAQAEPAQDQIEGLDMKASIEDVLMSDEAVTETEAAPQQDTSSVTAATDAANETAYATESLRDMSGLLREYFDRNKELGLILRLPTGHIIEANAAGLSEYCRSRESVVGKTLTESGLFESDRAWENLLEELKASKKPLRMSMRDASGELKPVELHHDFVEHDGERVLFLRAHSLSDQLRDGTALRARLLTDAATGLPNAQGFEGELVKAWARAAQESSSVGLLLIEVAPAKAIRDESGKPALDQWMSRCAESIKTGATRKSDVLVRLDWDQFGLILHAADELSAVPVAERIASSVQDLEVPVGFSERSIFRMGSAALRPTIDVAAVDLVRSAERNLRDARRERMLISGDLQVPVTEHHGFMH